MEQNYFSFNIIPVSNTDNDNRHITHSKTFLMLTPAPKYTGLHLSQLLRVTFLLSLNRPDCALLGKMSGVFVKKCLLGIKGKERPQHAETLWNRNAETLLSNALFNWGIPLKWPRQDPLLFFWCTTHGSVCISAVWECESSVILFSPLFLSFCLSGGVPAAGGGEQGKGVLNGPEQRWWSAGHVHVGRASWGRHHAQPSSAVPERLHLCKNLTDTWPHNAPWDLLLLYATKII